MPPRSSRLNLFGSGIPPWVGKGSHHSTRAPGSQSAGYHADLTIPGYKPKTPTVAPPAGEAATAPAAPSGGYEGSRRAYHRAVQALPTPTAPSGILAAVSGLLTPGGSSLHPRELAEVAHTLGVVPKALSSATDSAAHDLTKAVKVAVNLPKTKVESPDVLGSPTIGQVVKSVRKGTAQRTPKGKLTIPATRKAERQLRQAQRAYQRHAVPQIQGIADPDQREFAEWLSHYTKIPPKLAGEWVKQEGGGWGSHGVSGGQAGEQNWLGVGYPGQPTPFSRSPYFNNTTPKRAAKATAEWMEGKIGSEFGYSAAPSIRKIAALAKAGAPEAAIRSYIEGPSQWGTGRIAQSGVTAEGAHVSPKVRETLVAAKQNARSIGINPTPFNGDVGPGTGPELITIRADAQGMVHWAESALGTPEGSAKQAGWASRYGLSQSQPWCANFISNGLARRGVPLPPNPNFVPSYESEWSGGRNIGTDLSKAKPGDLIAFSGEHIGLYVGNGEMVSGNFGNEVARSPVSAGPAPVSAILRPNYKGGKIQVSVQQAVPGSTPESTFGGPAEGSATPGAAETGGRSAGGPRTPPPAAFSNNVPVSELLSVLALSPQVNTLREESGEPDTGTIARILSRRRL